MLAYTESQTTSFKMKNEKIYRDADYNYEYLLPTQVKTITYGRFILEKEKIEDLKYKIGSRAI